MKRQLAWVTAAGFLAVSMITACGSGSIGQREASASEGREQSMEVATNSESEQNVSEERLKITLWTYPVGNWGSQSSVSSLLTGFHQEYPQYRVQVDFLDYNTGDSVVEEAVAAGTAPDLVLEGPERLVANWGRRGLMADLSDLWESESAGQIYESVRDACCDVNGTYYEYPICMTTHCMAVNYDMFEKADALQYIDEENHTWTTENFIKAVEALKAGGQERAGVVYCGGQGGDQGTRALVTNLYGGTFTNPEHTAYTVDSPENEKALTLLQGMDGIEFDPTIAGGDEASLFSSGELAMAFCWNVTLELNQIINNQDAGFDVFPMAFPSESGEPKLQGGIWGFGIFDNGDAARIEAAKAFIRYMAEDDSHYKRAVQTSNYWPVRDVPGMYANDELMSEYGMFMKYMGDYYQVAPGWADVRTAWWEMLQKIGNGMDVREALTEFDDAAGKAAEAPLTETAG